MSETKEGPTVAEILRKQFPSEQIGKLPRGNIQIDYVGHADVTSRLLEADPEWNWEPQARDVDGDLLAAAIASGNPDMVRLVLENAPPKFDLDRNGNPVGLWIRLTVGGVTRPGYGSAPSNQSDAPKVLIGDAIRNAAMRFGVALDLWAKGDRADPARENPSGAGGHAARGRQRESFENARPANGNGNGNGRSNGQTVRPAAAEPAPSGPAELDPDAQPYADEAHEARTLAALKDINTRAREAHKLASLVKDPASGHVGGLGQYIGYRKRQLEDVEAALAALNDVAKKKRIDIGEVETQLKLITGKTIEDATPDEMRKAAEQMLAEVPA